MQRGAVPAVGLAEADCYCVVYSVADRDSFDSSISILGALTSLFGHRQPKTARILVANKTDLVRQRQVQQHGTSVALHVSRFGIVELAYC